MAPLLLALVVACSDVPDAEPLRTAREGGLESDALGPGVVGRVAESQDGSRRVWSRRVEGSLSTELVAAQWHEDRWVEHVVVADDNPDRPAIHPSGDPIAFVWARGGYASVWVVPFVGGDPVRITNVGVKPSKAIGPPVGWVAPPHDDSLRFDGDVLRWDAPDGPHQAVWR